MNSEMKSIKLFFVVFFLFTYCQSQEINFGCFGKIHKIKSISPENEKYNDLYFLNDIIKDKRIILLGEAGHSDGSTFLAKSRLIKYLIEKHGFNAIALEGGSFSNMNYPEHNSTIPPSALLTKYWYPIWSRAKELNPLFTYFDEIHHSSAIDIVGIESQMDFINSFSYLDSLYQYFERNNYDHREMTVNKDSLDYILKKHNKEILNRFLEKGKILSPAEWETLKDYLNILRTTLESQSIDRLNDLKGTYFLRSLNNSILWCESNLIDRDNVKELDEKIKQRDQAMFENLMWYMNNYPDKKIIIWAANFHIAHNLNNIIYTPDSSFYNYMIPLGHHIKEKFKEESYHIAFNHALGINDMNYSKDLTFEEYLFKKKYNYCFVDLDTLPNNDPCKEQVFRSQLFENIHKGKWFQCFDGIFFIRNMNRSTF